MTDNALVVFQEMSVAPITKAKILEMDPDFATRDPEEQKEIIEFWLQQAKATVEGVKSRFPKLKILHAGAEFFEMPGTAEEAKPDPVRKFSAIILDQYVTKAWWKDKFEDGDGGPPDCASIDGLKPYTKNPVTPVDKGGCVVCPLNRFGSAVNDAGEPTRGKACRDTKRIIMYMEGHELPVRLLVSAANIGRFDSYMNDLRDQGLPLGTIRTLFETIGAKSRDGRVYTGLKLSTIERLPMSEQLRIKREVVDVFRADFRQGAVEVEDRDGGGTSAPTRSAGARKKDATKARSVM